jgi:hypothetical protein
MGNYGVITGQATAQRLTAGTQQLTLASIADNEGVAILANQFTVDGIGNYLASIKFYPAAIGKGMACTIQIWNATTAALAGSAPLMVPLNISGNVGLSVNIPFNVVNTAHNFQIRIVVPGDVRTPNACDLAIQGGTIMQAIISSTAADISGGGEFGDGVDGDVVIAASAPIAKDMYYNNLTINAGQALATAGFRIFVRNILTMAAGSSITGNGAAGTGADGPGAAGAAAVGQTVGAGFIGAAPAPGPGFGAGVAGTNATTTGGGAGGASGAGGGGAGAAGGTATAPTPAQGGPTAANVVRAMPNAVTTALAGALVATLLRGGAGGASGGGSGAQTGAGGGGGGGVVVVAARNIVGTGTIEANGGAGGAGSAAANAGGGGGGGGGFVLTVSNGTLPVTLTTRALGGAAGAAGAGGGVAGAAGAAGNTVHVKLGQ